MDRDQLIDLTRRAVKLARDKTTDLTPSEHSVAADTHTSTQTPRTGHGDAVGQSAGRRLCLRTPPARHLLHQDGYGPFGVRPQRTWAAAPPPNVVRGDQPSNVTLYARLGDVFEYEVAPAGRAAARTSASSQSRYSASE